MAIPWLSVIEWEMPMGKHVEPVSPAERTTASDGVACVAHCVGRLRPGPRQAVARKRTAMEFQASL